MPTTSDHFTVLAIKTSDFDEKDFRQIYDHTSGKMYSLCLRYVSNTEDAADVLQEGYVKIFRNLHKYKGEGSLEGWIRRVFVTTCLDFLKKKRMGFAEINDSYYAEAVDISGLDKLSLDELMKLIRQMPNGYRTVFNLHIEGYNHSEIGEMLGIGVSTSKSQLAKAKKYLKEIISNEA